MKKMNNIIIENIMFDNKVTDKFYVIQDNAKLEKNSTFIKNYFHFISTEEGYNYGCFQLEFENNIYLSFTNEYGFRLDFVMMDIITTVLDEKIIKYLSCNVDDEIRRMIIDFYEDFSDS